MFGVLTIVSAVYCAHNVSRYLSGLSNFEFDCLRNALAPVAVPAIRAGKPLVIEVKQTDQSHLPNNIAYVEYGGVGMSNRSPGYVMAATIFVLREFGIETVEATPAIKVERWDRGYALMKTWWGYIYVTGPYGIRHRTNRAYPVDTQNHNIL